MKAKSGILVVILFLFTEAHALQAQQPAAKTPFPQRSVSSSPFGESSSQPEIYYRLDFAIRETDGEKLVDKRNYSLWVQSGVDENMSAGSEVPYPSSSYQTSGAAPAKSINYRSVGVSILCHIKEGDDGPIIDMRINISDALPPEKGSDAPAFRNVTLNSRTVLSLGKPTTVGIVEDPGSRHRYQVDVTATKLK